MSDTPETDAAVIASGGDWSPVLRETCRRLERERNEAREVIRNIVWAGRVGRQWQNYAIEFLEKLEETK